MTLDLSTISFTNDFFTLSLPNGNTLIFNSIDEKPSFNNNDVIIKAINIQISSEDNEYYTCTNVIGLSDSYISLKTDYNELEGKVLTEENLSYVTLEVLE